MQVYKQNIYAHNKQNKFQDQENRIKNHFGGNFAHLPGYKNVLFYEVMKLRRVSG